MFYTFDVEQSTTLTFVELSILPILEKHTNTNLYIVPKICRSEASAGRIQPRAKRGDLHNIHRLDRQKN